MISPSFFPAIFSTGRQTCLSSMNDVQILFVTFMQTRYMYLHFTRSNNGLTAINKILVAASFLCYSMGAR